MTHRDFFKDLSKRLATSAFGTVAAYVAGYDAGTDHSALFGFDEWLAMKSGVKGRAWIAAVPHIAFAGIEPPKPYAAAEDKIVVGQLFELIDEFLGEVGPLTARRELIRKYLAWEAQH